MVKNLVSGLILAQIWAQKVFSWALPLLDITYCCKLSLYDCCKLSLQFQEELMNQIWENGKKPSFRNDFGPNLVPKNFFRGLYL